MLFPVPGPRKETRPEPKPVAAPIRGSLRLVMASDEPGLVESPASSSTSVAIHVGAPSDMVCSRRGERHHGIAVHGDIDIIPSGTPSRWELKDRDTALILSLS